MFHQYFLSFVFKYESRFLFKDTIILSRQSKSVNISVLKSSRTNFLAVILCMVEHELLTDPTLYVSNSFHQYNGAQISIYTTIILINFLCDGPALTSLFIKVASLHPRIYTWSAESTWSSVSPIIASIRGILPYPLSDLSQEFIGLRIPRIDSSKP